MKIGLVRRGHSGTGGAEAYLLRLAAGLQQSGHEPVLITTRDWPDDRWPHAGIIRIKGKNPSQFAESFQETNTGCDTHLSLERVPGCEVYRAGDGVHAAWLHRRSRFEPFWKRWFHLLNPKHLAVMRLECEVFQTAQSIIANSRMVAEEISRWHELPQAGIHVIPNGIGPALAPMPKKEARELLNIPQDTFCILFVGTGWERKGLRFAIKAVEQLESDALLLVAGRGKEHHYRSSRVRFLGPVQNLSPVFSAADIFTLPTIYDPFSNACLEALAAGLPVITSQANGFHEIMTPGIHGEVVPTGDVEDLASAFKEWKKPSRLQKARPECVALAAEYSIERNVSATMEVLFASTSKNP